ncbi:hypothetical protein E3N88_38303 [Mikania micrantha]|uniref:Uncharacterized protein n=1 Tax=Mikania micrantha TaxID=192012 RepID=A0A5N6LTK1_9ASTR|nr:hypothetical protein E3N88_38303 [Mikania micrantha]
MSVSISRSMKTPEPEVHVTSSNMSDSCADQVIVEDWVEEDDEPVAAINFNNPSSKMISDDNSVSKPLSSSSSRTSINVVSNSGDDLQSDIQFHKNDTFIENPKVDRYVLQKPRPEIKAPSLRSFQNHNKRGVKHKAV